MILPLLIRPKEIFVVAPLLFVGYLIFIGIWFLANYFNLPRNFPFFVLVLTILVGALYIVVFLKIMSYIRKKK